MENVFVLPDESYNRHIDPVTDYIKQSAWLVSRLKNIDYEEAEKKVKDIIKQKKFNRIHNPVVRYAERQENGDRVEQQTTLLSYIKSSVKQNELIAPTLTTYFPHNEKQSLLVDYVENNIKQRSIVKKAGQAAEAAGQTQLAQIANREQNAYKTENNSQSGTFSTRSSPLYNPTAHNTLTSNCRVVSSFGNANNEKLVTGNRHYWSPYIAYNNIISIVTNSDLIRAQQFIDNFGLHYPTIEETMECITYSTNLYWQNKQKTEWIHELVKTLTPVERAVFVYTGDLYHIAKFNEKYVRDFLQKLSTKTITAIDNALEIVKTIDEAILTFTHQVCIEEVRGYGKDYKNMQENNVLNTVVGTALNIQNTLLDYKEFIQIFFTTTNIPVSIAHFPDSIRRSVILSDTDSTIFTVQNWIKWFTGNDEINNFTKALAGAIVFIAGQSIVHILSVMSANFGFPKKYLHTMTMKSEFFWPVFIKTNKGKHYIATCEIQEGNVFSKIKREIKGVHLKSSTLPKYIINDVNNMMNEIMDNVLENKTVSLEKYIKHVSDVEKYISNSILEGRSEFLKLDKVKLPGSYGLSPDKSPYLRHYFWEEVMQDKYGPITPPPYSVLKIPTILDKPAKVKAWLTTLEDQDFAKRFDSWMIKYNKKQLPTIYISTEYVKGFGIPNEIKSIIATKRIILDLCNVYYIILESLSFYRKELLTITEMLEATPQNQIDLIE